MFAVAQSPDVWQAGKLYPKVVCLADATQSYALYLPTSYRKDQAAPVIFVFEPAARGPLPVSIAQRAAEKFGFVVIASNNSRNGPFAPQIAAADAMWKDAHERFSLDSRRTYFAGFSGGSRLAVMFTARCKQCSAGVIASGAAFAIGMEPKSVPKFLYFGSVGNEDFNYPEYLQIEPKLKEAGFTYHLRRFNGAHEWPPADVWLDALEWFNLQAVRSGILPKDQRVIDEGYSRRLGDAASQTNELEKFRAYSQLASDFAGLTDVSGAQKHAAELANTKTVKDLARREQRDAEDQRRLSAPFYAQLEALKNSEQRTQATVELRSLFGQLASKAKDDKDPQQLVARRVRMQEFVHFYETGMELITQQEYSSALIIYDAIVLNAKAAPGAHLQKSKIYLLMGDKKKGLMEAQLAVKNGVRDPESFSEPEFAALRGDPEFKALLDSLHPTKAE